VTNKGSKAHTIKKVAVIGGGLMDFGIATALILSGIKVYLKEINSEFLQAGIQQIESTTPRTLQKDY
jgi:enoyl-CoA hydratase/3-hydroxyacyl-CoA dehydrogenase